MKYRVYHIGMLLAAMLMLASCGAETAVQKGNQAAAIGEYYQAAKYYKKAYTKTKAKDKKKRAERSFLMGECYRKIHYASRAASAYQNAVRYNYPDSLALRYLAEQQLLNGNYKQASENFKLYLDKAPADMLAQNGLKSSLQSQEWKKNPSRYIVKKFPTLNGSRSDYCPMYPGKENDRIFTTSTRKEATGENESAITGMKCADIFVTKKDEQGRWEKTEAIEGEVNSEYEDGACAFTPDGKTMYFTRCATDDQAPRYAQIFKSARSDASWGKPEAVAALNDSLTSYAHPAVSPDGNWLYFTSDMTGGYGGLDIWRLFIGNDATLSGIIENMGPTINTAGNEEFPALRPNGELYYSSDGMPGMGGLDIFKAVQVNDSVWKVENLQSPVNSNGDDFGMTFEGEYNRGFFSSNRGDARGWDHIFSFELPEIIYSLNGWIYEKEGYELPQGTIRLVGNDGTNEVISAKGDGSYEKRVQPGVSYVLLGSCKGYLNYKQELTTDTTRENHSYQLDFPLSSITLPVLIDNIFYDFDKATLTPQSAVALDSLIILLNMNPNVTIELSAHCDYRGSDVYNQRLSQRRAESVVEYLIKGGIATDRLQPKGYGESRPKVIRKKLTEKYPFLHEGDTLTEAFIKALPDEEKQEICNQLNRRTEFQVMRTTYQLYGSEGSKPEEEASPAAEEPKKE